MFTLSRGGHLVSAFYESPVLEKDIEREGCDFALLRGWVEFKVTAVGCRGFPDRLYIRAGVVVFVEWKRPGEKLNEQQVKRHRELRAAGAKVVVLDNFQAAVELFQ
jgi:hypothetical protein